MRNLWPRKRSGPRPAGNRPDLTGVVPLKIRKRKDAMQIATLIVGTGFALGTALAATLILLV
ncbi:hypothetical protein LV82_01963 [Albidovulum inexpectatum]|uniref:Uncharacterized protein n=1 Tax=Albidovulum inexpectatum TaxID=196587 RepID=A0A2S5JGI9_9RHOB|nr:hypothetical protein LV82_01963 [Albidovulum inexpectatum]